MRPSITAPNPNSYVNAALRTIGLQSVTNGCLIHNIQGWLLEEILPESLRSTLVMKPLLGARAKALRNKKKNENKSE